MDRSWINSRLFGKPHLDGVSEFMKLVSENFGADEQILGFLDIKDWWRITYIFMEWLARTLGGSIMENQWRTQ